MSMAQLVAHEKRNVHLDFLFFWGHQPATSGIGPCCLSQWWPGGFVTEGIHYHTAEHYMMAEKAALFGDYKARQAVLDCSNPADAKALGRKIQGFDEDTWARHRQDVVMRGNLAKFRQNPELADFLIGTGKKILVEASPYDRIWGLGASDERARQPSQWKGLNLLGFSLMDVRTHLANASFTR
jgi:ribA/ribD-fused uncharacterized protein